MGIFRDEQTRLLKDNGTENIEFFVYDKEGNAKTTLKQSKDVLKQIPSNLAPINSDLIVEYIRPLRDAIKTTKTETMSLINKNPNFRYNSFNWNITSSKAVIAIPSGVYSRVNPISGVYCLFQSALVVVPFSSSTQERTTHMLKNTLSDTRINSGKDLEISWNYRIETLPGIGAVGVHQYMSLGLDSTNNGTINKMYDFEENRFRAECSDCGEDDSAIAFTDDRFFKKIDYTQFDSWNKYKTLIQTNLLASDTNPHIEFKLFAMSASGNFGAAAFFDGVSISEKLSTKTRLHTRRRGNQFKIIDGSVTEADDNVTGEYKQAETLLSNEIDLADIHSIQGTFTRKDRPLDVFNTNTLDKCVLQEIINDYRLPIKQYEGSFYKDDSDVVPIYFYHKLWINFGNTVLQEPVSAIIDSLEFDVKQNQYRIVMHLPNQDDDKVSFDLYKFE